jgi:hypothetical protein
VGFLLDLDMVIQEAEAARAAIAMFGDTRLVIWNFLALVIFVLALHSSGVKGMFISGPGSLSSTVEN